MRKKLARLKTTSKATSKSAMSTTEALILLCGAAVIITLNAFPAQKEMIQAQEARAEAAVTQLEYRKQRYLFESSPSQILSFNQMGDADRWQILVDTISRNKGPVSSPEQFVAGSGKTQLVIGDDATPVSLQ